jgi:hypothetical protein
MMKTFGRVTVSCYAVVLVLACASSAWAQPNTPAQFGNFRVPAFIHENGLFYEFDFAIVDDDPSQVTLFVLADPKTNPDLVPASAFSFSGTANQRRVTYRPPYDRSGDLLLSFALGEPGFTGHTDSQAFIGFVIPVSSAPALPTGLTSAPAGALVNFSWTLPNSPTPPQPSNLPSYYQLEIGEAPGLTALPPMRIPARQSVISMTLPRGGYTYRLRPGNRLGLGPVTAESSIGLANGPNIPGPPAGLSISLSPSGVATATWAPPGFGAPPLAYIIEVGTAAGSSNIGEFQLPAAARSASGSLGPGTYAVRVRGVSAAGEGPASAEVFITFPGGPCSPPAAPTLGTLLRNGSMVMVPWTAPATGQAESYQLAAGTSPGAADIAVLPVPPGTSYFQVAPGAGIYHVVVQALSSCGSSGPSNVVTYVEPAPAIPGAPHTFTGTTGPGSASLNWNPPVTGSKVDDYILEAGFSPGDTAIRVPLPGNVPGIAFTGVPPGTYFVRIKASNEVGTSPPSNEIALTVP